VRLIEDGALSSSGRRGATLSVEISGERLEHTVDHVAGDASLPMTRQQIAAKFARYARRPPDAAPRFLDAFAGRRFGELLEELAAPPGPSQP
jgi:hypothetical protein